MLSQEDSPIDAASLRFSIAKHEAALRTARSPRSRLAHQFRPAIARQMLKGAEERLDG